MGAGRGAIAGRMRPNDPRDESLAKCERAMP